MELFEPYNYLTSAIFFICAYLGYRILLTIFRRFLRDSGVWKAVLEAMRLPSLFIFLEIAAVASINIFGIRQVYEELSEHIITIMIMTSIGWLLANITRGVYHHFYNKYEAAGALLDDQRGMITQVLFLYRLIMFIIVSVTIATILMTFPQIKSVGIGILSSAGIAGIALGVAARPILLNLMAGFQIAMTKTITIGDAVLLEGDFCRIEAINLTHVVARTWDLRRIILPISYFIDKPFQNWDVKDSELLGSVFIYCDYTAPIDQIRHKVEEIVEVHEKWNRKVVRVNVTNCTEKTVEIRILMSADDASSSAELRHFVREKVVAFLQEEHPLSLPCLRQKKIHS